MKLVIGTVGMPLAGKETVANTLEALLKKDGFSVSRVRFSDILRDTLDLWNIPHGRENEQLLAIVMAADGAFKDGALSRAMKHRLATMQGDVAILDGARWLSDEAMLRELPTEGVKSLIIYIATSAERRYARLKQRNRSGENMTSWEDFLRQDQAKTETSIADIGSRADIILKNGYEKIEDFQKDIAAGYEKIIKSALR